MAGVRRWALPLGAATAYVGLAVATARGAGQVDREALREVNEEDHRRPWLRVPQQAGTPWVLPALAGFGWWRGDRALAATAPVALPLEKALEVGTKKLSQRPRPAQVETGVRLRDDAPTDGPSYPSGHAAIATCAVTLASYRFGARVAVPAGLVAALTGGARVHQGAHFPGDVTGGSLLGVALGSSLAVLATEWRRRTLF